MRSVNPFEEWFASYDPKTGALKGWVWGLFDCWGELVEMKDYIAGGGVPITDNAPGWVAVRNYLSQEPERVKAQEKLFGRRAPDFIK